MSAAAAVPPPARRPRPLVLCSLDGLGEHADTNEHADADRNAIPLPKAPNLSALAASAQKALIGTSDDVGLAPGHVDHGAVDPSSFGVDRGALADGSRIDAVIKRNQLGTNEVIERTFRIAMDWKCRVHLFGLISDGGVHASLDHWFSLLHIARFHEIPVVVHAFLDGQDMPPKSALDPLRRLEAALEGVGVIGTLSGRSFAMDRDRQWDRVMSAYTAIVRGDAPRADTVFDAIQESYAAGRTDDLIEPVRIGEYEGITGSFMADFAAAEPIWTWYGEEVGLAVNFRSDRLRELSAMLVRRNVPPEVEEWLTDRTKPVIAFQKGCYSSMTEVDPALKLPVAFPREVRGLLDEAISRAGLKQLRCEVSALEGAAEVVGAILAGQHDVLLVSFAKGGPPGARDAPVQAVEAIDAAVGAIVAAARQAGGALLVTAPHGTSEPMMGDQGSPPATNPALLYYLNESDPVALRSSGRISDIAPTVLEILGLPQPDAMTGRSLRVPR